MKKDNHSHTGTPRETSNPSIASTNVGVRDDCGETQTNIPADTHNQERYNMIELDEELFEGYVSEVNDGIIISHIRSRIQGRGDFSRLLKGLQERYKWIKVPTPSNHMREILLRKGFIEQTEFFPYPFNCNGEIMFWEKIR
jgi:hypothetical protein